jgi:hypothetical protein
MKCILCEKNGFVSITLDTGKIICLSCFDSIKKLESFAPYPLDEPTEKQLKKEKRTCV